MVKDYNGMGPRLDLGGPGLADDPKASDLAAGSNYAAKAPVWPGVMAVLALLAALTALGLALWSTVLSPQREAMPPLSDDAIPGATAERVAKLEKDTLNLGLRLGTLEKELENLRGRSGSMTKLAELSAKLEAAQGRLDSLEKRVPVAPEAKPAAASPAPAPPKAETSQDSPAAKADERTKHTYVVRSGDTLFTVAQRYKVPMKDIQRWNNMNNDNLRVGQTLIIYK